MQAKAHTTSHRSHTTTSHHTTSHDITSHDAHHGEKIHKTATQHQAYLHLLICPLSITTSINISRDTTKEAKSVALVSAHIAIHLITLA